MQFHKSNKPLVWLPFAAGGMAAAFILPVLILITGVLVPFGLIGPQALSYETMHSLAANAFGKIALAGCLILPLWHGAHRFRMTVHDLIARSHGARSTAAVLCYGFGGLFTIVCVAALLAIW